MMTDYSEEIVERGLSTDAQDLAAIAFSLWRAVFLADRRGTTEAKMADAKDFVEKMLTDNAIAFTQDRTAREWTFSYYTDNAWYRLKDLGHKNLVPPSGKRTARNRWDYLEDAFEDAVFNFSRKLTSRKVSN